MQRRSWMIFALALITQGTGCSGSRRAGKKPRGQAGRRPRGPKTMGKLLVTGYITDLKSGSTERRITAANELANMGAAAQAALPALKPLVKHADAKLAAAAAAAIKSIEK